MDLTEFLSLVTPHEGFRYIVAIEKGPVGQTKRIQQPYKSYSHAVELVGDLEPSDNHNTYFSCASFLEASYKDPRTGRTRKRTKANALNVRAIWRDFDVGFNEDGKPKPNAYATQTECIHAVEEMCGTLGLPHPLMISSGNGIHAYWTFNRDIPKAEWLRIAHMTVQVFNAKGVLSDPARDTDITSILRPPGTLNKGKYKTSTLKQVEFIRQGDAPINPDDFVALLSPHVVTDPLAHVPDFMRGNASVANELAQKKDYPPSYAEIAATKCAQIGHFKETGGSTYSLWWLGLGFCKSTVEGEDKAHEWAAKHDGYDRSETQFKLDEWAAGPPTCEKFADEGGRCTGCAFKGKVRSPIALGLEETAPAKDIEIVVENAEGAEEGADDFIKAHVPEGYVVDNGVLKKLAIIDNVPVQLEVCRTFFWFEDRYESLSGEMVFGAVSCVRKNKKGQWQTKQFEVPASIVGSGGKELYSRLGEREIFPSQEKGAKSRMDTYVVDMANQLRARKKQINTYKYFGWQENNGFLIGETLYDANGEHKVVVSGDSAPSILPAFKNNGGTAASWSEIAEAMYAHPSHEAYQTIVLFGIGSPLLRLYDYPTGCLVNMVGGAGMGKTTVASVGLSAYGNPQGLMTELRSTTEMALYDRIATHHSIPVNIDELTNIEPLKMSTMTYTIMNAQPRERLKSDGSRNAKMIPWATVSFASSNGSMREVISAFKADASAELSRLIEIDWPEIQTIERREMDTLLGQLKGNYGSIGTEFVKYVCQNEAKVSKQLNKMREFVETELHIDKESRFWSAHIAIPLTTKMIMQKMGYLDKFHTDDIMNICLSTIREHKVEMKSLTLDNKAAFHAMLTAFSDKIISTQQLKDARWATPDGVIMHGEPVGRAILNENDLYLSIAAVREWCSEKRVNYKKLCKELTDLEILKGNDRFYLGRGTTRMTGQIYCWHLDLQRVLGFSQAKASPTNDGHLTLVKAS